MVSNILMQRAPYAICNQTPAVLSLGLILIIIHRSMVGRIQNLDSFLMSETQEGLMCKLSTDVLTA
jgi:hypothetical protein